MKYVAIVMNAIAWVIFCLFCIGLIFIQKDYKGGIKEWYSDYMKMFHYGRFFKV